MLASTVVLALAVPVCFVGDVLLSEEELGGEVHHGGRNSVMNGQHLRRRKMIERDHMCT